MGHPASPVVRTSASLAQGIPGGSLIGGRYRVLRPLKAGGMGSVYEAQHQGTQRHVALKVIRPELVANPEARRRFETEARIGAVLASRHIVDVLDAGIDETTGVPFIAMELLPGCDLEELATQRGRFSAAETLMYLAQIARALDRAHVQGIVHRDLKPENLFLANLPDEEPHIKILDFGIAKLLHQYVGGSTNQVTGTPLYMAPEQAQTPADISPATDIWALGLIAYRLLVGRTYWQAGTVHALYAEILVNPLSPPTERAAGAGCHLPKGFDAWFFGCVDRDPTQRFKSASQAVAALAHLYGAPAPVPAHAAPEFGTPYVPVAPRAAQLTELAGGASLPAAGARMAPAAVGATPPSAACLEVAQAAGAARPPAGHGPPLGAVPATLPPSASFGAGYSGAYAQQPRIGAFAPTMGQVPETNAFAPGVVQAPQRNRLSPMAVTAIVVGMIVAGLLVAVVVVLARSGGWWGMSRGSREPPPEQPATDGQAPLGNQGASAALGGSQPTMVAPLAEGAQPLSSNGPLLRYRSPSACPGAYWVQVAIPADATPDDYDFPVSRNAIAGERDLAGCCFVMARNPVGRRIFGGIAPNKATAQRLKEVLDEKIGSHGRAIQSKAGLEILHGTFFLDELGNVGFFAQPR